MIRHENYLRFRETNCKNCYKCLRECPVKAIAVINDQAKIREDMCVLCGHCTEVCHFNAKEVASDVEPLKKLLGSGRTVIASVAPAYVSSFSAGSFGAMEAALKKLGFAAARETAEGAALVTAEYDRLLKEGTYKNLIASACPSIVSLIRRYYPAALKYLAPVDSPMVAHAKLIKAENKNAAVVFIGPCIAKKREAAECGKVDLAVTFEELAQVLAEQNVKIENTQEEQAGGVYNRARYYPINRGIIKSFPAYAEGYEYISVDGLRRAAEVLDNAESLSGMFIEMHACEFSCINGPCALVGKGGFIKATEQVRGYVKRSVGLTDYATVELPLRAEYLPEGDKRKMPSDEEIKEILKATGKLSKEDELNCGACGYPTCRDKAIAVYNNMAELSMCVPYMRARSESTSFDIIHSSPNGIISVDEELCITEINPKAIELLGAESYAKGEPLEKYLNPADFFLAMRDGTMTQRKKLQLPRTGAWVEMSVKRVSSQKVVFCIMKDITGDISYQNKINALKQDTVSTTNEVIAKQMRVVQEIASLLGETAAETKIALIKLKETISKEGE